MKKPQITWDTSNIPVLSVVLRGVFYMVLKLLTEQSTSSWLQNLTAVQFPSSGVSMGAGKAAAFPLHRC